MCETTEAMSVDKVVVCMEDMFSVGTDVHNKVGFSGRAAMEPFARQFIRLNCLFNNRNILNIHGNATSARKRKRN